MYVLDLPLFHYKKKRHFHLLTLNKLDISEKRG